MRMTTGRIVAVTVGGPLLVAAVGLSAFNMTGTFTNASEHHEVSYPWAGGTLSVDVGSGSVRVVVGGEQHGRSRVHRALRVEKANGDRHSVVVRLGVARQMPWRLGGQQLRGELCAHRACVGRPLFCTAATAASRSPTSPAHCR